MQNLVDRPRATECWEDVPLLKSDAKGLHIRFRCRGGAEEAVSRVAPDTDVLWYWDMGLVGALALKPQIRRAWLRQRREPAPEAGRGYLLSSPRLSFQRIAQLLRRVTWKQIPPGASDAARTVLEHFEGWVERVEGATAFVLLKSEHGDLLEGEYPADDLARKGIGDGSRFTCRTVDTGLAVLVELELLPDRAPPPERDLELSLKLDAILKDDDLSGDY